MQEKKSYEYVVVRLVPVVEREEFLNVGVILYAPTRKFLQMKFHLDKKGSALFTRELTSVPFRNTSKHFNASVAEKAAQARWENSQPLSVSAGCLLHGAPCCRCPKCTPACAVILKQSWTNCSGSWYCHRNYHSPHFNPQIFSR